MFFFMCVYFDINSITFNRNNNHFFSILKFPFMITGKGEEDVEEEVNNNEERMKIRS